MGLSSTIIYTSELILCSTICVPSATRHNIHMYPYFLFAAIHHLKSSPTFSVRPCSSVGRVMVDLLRRLWVRFPPRSKDFFFALCGSLFPFSRADAQWVTRGFKVTMHLQGCLACKGCSVSGLNCRYLSPYIKLKLIGLAIRLYRKFWKKMNCQIFHDS